MMGAVLHAAVLQNNIRKRSRKCKPLLSLLMAMEALHSTQIRSMLDQGLHAAACQRVRFLTAEEDRTSSEVRDY